MKSVAIGLFLFVFALLALTGPGRIDIIDGQVRYEVSRSLVDHGDVTIRNPNVWFNVFPGRNGKRYTPYRFPQSALGVGAILLSDATGPRSEQRRHFFYSLTSAAAAAALAVFYLIWFRRRGLGERAALSWAIAGIVCTPSWYYGTSTFDDILGTLAIVAAIVVASSARASRRLMPAVWAGLLVGLAFNCKQPLAAFGLAAVAAGDVVDERMGRRLLRAGIIVAGLVAGIAIYLAYDFYKFPHGAQPTPEMLKVYQPIWPGHPLIALIALAISPAAGVLWYSPTIVLCVKGIRDFVARERVFIGALLGGIVIFVGFIASLSFFKGDVAWGPRYLTPVLGIAWLFVARGVARSPRSVGPAILAAAFVVQLMGIAVVPGRLYIERHGIPVMLGGVAPILYFDPANAHLVQRPREIVEVWSARHEPGTAFSPAVVPTEACFMPSNGRRTIATYKVLDSFRPWWANQVYLPPEQRSVSIPAALALFIAAGLAGLGLIALGTRRTTFAVESPARWSPC